MTILNRSICPRCSNPGFPGILVAEDSGRFISCLTCGFIVRDEGRYYSNFKPLFDKYKPPQKKDNDISDPFAKLLGLLVSEPDPEALKKDENC